MSKLEEALATGSWSASARLKLRAAGLQLGGLPLATSDDAISRAGIFEVAVALAANRNGGAGLDRVVSVGDGVWDVETARQLGVPFVGVTADAYGGTLEELGAEVLSADFLDPIRVHQALAQAPIPTATWLRGFFYTAAGRHPT
ncbi:MAG: hypothetical protein VYE73_09870 [Acidobacteriota bacterium]|nr:hypothetical protein [Acidobacteriota bacterium]